MYQLQVFKDGEWTDTSYMPTEWETAKRRLSYYSAYWPNHLYSLLAVR